MNVLKIKVRSSKYNQSQIPFDMFYIVKEAEWENLKEYFDPCLIVKPRSDLFLRILNLPVDHENFHGLTRQSETKKTLVKKDTYRHMTSKCVRDIMLEQGFGLSDAPGNLILVRTKAVLRKDKETGKFIPRPVYMVNKYYRHDLYQRGKYEELKAMKLFINGREQLPCVMCALALQRLSNWGHCSIGSAICLDNLFFNKKYCASIIASKGQEAFDHHDYDKSDLKPLA